MTWIIIYDDGHEDDGHEEVPESESDILKENMENIAKQVFDENLLTSGTEINIVSHALHVSVHP
jgi:hypothetical protein